MLSQLPHCRCIVCHSLCISLSVGNLDKMTIVDLGRQHQRSLDSYFKSSLEYLCLFGVISYRLIPSRLLKLIVYIYIYIF